MALLAALLSQGSFLGSRPVQGDISKIQKSARYELYSDKPQYLFQLLKWTGAKVQLDDGFVELIVYGAPTIPGSHPGVQERISSFLVDHEEAPVQHLRAKLKTKHQPELNALALRDFVHDYIKDKNYERVGFDLASKVAQTRKGDCTEHAVLLAAIARMVGLYARLTLGFVLPSKGPAIGHLWTEIYERGRWVAIDATKVRPTFDLGYIRLGNLEVEGPAYMMGVAALQSHGISKIVVTEHRDTQKRPETPPRPLDTPPPSRSSDRAPSIKK